MTQSPLQPWLREILRCPACKHEFEPAQGAVEESLTCANPECRRTYRIEDGVPVLLVDEATRPE